MGIIKDNNYSEEELDLGKLLNAISHPARRRVLNLLREQFVIRNIDLTHFLNLSPAAVSTHLNKLRDADLIEYHYFIHHHEIVLKKDPLKRISNYLESF